MSELVVTAVYDSGVLCYSSVQTFRTRMEAMRAFGDACGDVNMFSKHPADFFMCQIGTFDDQSGVLTGTSPAPVLITALEVMQDRQVKP